MIKIALQADVMIARFRRALWSATTSPQGRKEMCILESSNETDRSTALDIWRNGSIGRGGHTKLFGTMEPSNFNIVSIHDPTTDITLPESKGILAGQYASTKGTSSCDYTGRRLRET